MRNILLKLAYVGTNYSGWQRQKNGVAVQQLVEEAIEKITGENIKLTGCSRTDAGVHAEQYFANFNTNSEIPVARFKPAIQSKLPSDIMIRKSQLVAPDFNARRNALEKKYRYQIYLGTSPFFNNRWWQNKSTPDYMVLKELGSLIVGRHDFSGFCVVKSLKKDNHCCIKQVSWRKEGRKLYFSIVGDRFLHRMVRFLVGVQFEVATGKMSKSTFENILLHPRENRALFPAPPCGLYLAKVKYR